MNVFAIISQDSSSSDSEEEQKCIFSQRRSPVAMLTAEPTVDADSDASEKSALDPKEFILDYVDGDEKVVKKAMKLLDSFKLAPIAFLSRRSGELTSKKLISRFIKLCGIETAKSFCCLSLSCRNILSSPSSLFAEAKLQDELRKAVNSFNWPRFVDGAFSES